MRWHQKLRLSNGSIDLLSNRHRNYTHSPTHWIQLCARLGGTLARTTPAPYNLCPSGPRLGDSLPGKHPPRPSHRKLGSIGHVLRELSPLNGRCMANGKLPSRPVIVLMGPLCPSVKLNCHASLSHLLFHPPVNVEWRTFGA